MYPDAPRRRLLDPHRPNRDSSRRGKLYHSSRHPQYCPRDPTVQRSTRRTLPSVQQHHPGARRFCLSRHHLPVCTVSSVSPAGFQPSHHTGDQDALQGLSQQDGVFKCQPCRSVRLRCVPPVKRVFGDGLF